MGFINSALLAIVLPTYGWRALWAVTAAFVVPDFPSNYLILLH